MCRKVCTLTIGSPCLLWDEGCERFVSGNRREFSAAFIWRHGRRESMVLHCFQKKSRKTSQQDLDLAEKRFKEPLIYRWCTRCWSLSCELLNERTNAHRI